MSMYECCVPKVESHEGQEHITGHMSAKSQPGSLRAWGVGNKRWVGKSQLLGAHWIVPVDVPTHLDCDELH